MEPIYTAEKISINLSFRIVFCFEQYEQLSGNGYCSNVIDMHKQQHRTENGTPVIMFKLRDFS